MPMSGRTRTTPIASSIDVPVSYTYTYTKSPRTNITACKSFGPGSGNVNQTIICENFSDIRDKVGTFDLGEGYPMRSVAHEKWMVNIPNSSYGPSYGTCDVSATITGAKPGFRFSDLSMLKAVRPPDSEFPLWCDDVYPTLVQQFPTEVSLANFVWELRELKDLIPKIQSGLSETVANGYLTLEFGWLPLIGDLQKLWNIQKTVKTRLDYLLARWGKPTRVSKSKKFTWTPSITTRSYTVFSVAGVGCRVSLARSETTYRAGGYLFHTLEWLRQADAEWHAMIGSLGFLDPLSVIWEAIPYSFVVDWVTSVGSWIERYGHIVEEADHWKVYRLCSSRKTVADWHIFQTNPLGSNQTLSYPERFLGSLTYSHYERFAGLPVSSLFDEANLVSPKQLALLAALVTGRN